MATAADRVRANVAGETVVDLDAEGDTTALHAGTVDLVVSSGAFEPSPETLAEIARVLRPAGRLAIRIAGRGLAESEYAARLDDAGFKDARVEVEGATGAVLLTAVKRRRSEGRFLPPVPGARACGCC